MLHRRRKSSPVAAALGATLLIATAPAGAQDPGQDLVVDQLPSSDANGAPQYTTTPDAYVEPRFAQVEWYGPWDPAQWFPGWGCDVPTVWDCMDPAWADGYCGQVDAWVQSSWPGGSPCEYVLGVAFAEWTSTSEYAERLDARDDGSLYLSSEMPMQVEYSYFYDGAPTTYLDEILLISLEAKNPAAVADGIIAPKAIKRGVWEANGAYVTSCREYVWEKWYDWSRFEDATGGVDGDFARFVFDRAFDPVTGISERLIRSRNGAPQRDVRFPEGAMPKNAYFLYEPTPFDRYPMDPSILPHESGREYHKVDWAWHRDRSVDLAGVPDATLAHEYARQVAFKKLLARRADVLEDLITAAAGGSPVILTTSPTLATWVPFSVAAKFTEDTSAMTSYVGSSSAAAARAVSALSPGSVTTVIDAAAIPEPMTVVVDPAAGKYVYADTGGTTGKMGQLYLIDKEIAAYLTHARDAGCLNMSATTACDWSPELFAEQLRGQFATERERDLQTCMEKTGDDFSPGAMIHDPGAFGVPFAIPGLDYASDSEAVRAFFAIYDLYVRDYLDFTPEPGSVTEPAKGFWKYDKKAYGSDDWNVGYEYKVGWGLQKNSGAKLGLCDTDLRVQGMAKATAELAGKTIQIIDGDNSLTSQDGVFHAHSHLEILGKKIYDPIDDWKSEVTYKPVNFKLVAKPSYAATIVIVFVPVTIEVGVAGEAGLAAEITGSLERACPSAGPATLEISATAGLTPFIHVSGFGSVGVGVKGFQAKLQVDLDLLNLDVPFSVTAKLAPTTASLSSLQFTALVKLDLHLKTLSGRVRGILETFWKNYSTTIFEWRGIEAVNETGWSREWKIPVASVLEKI